MLLTSNILISLKVKSMTKEFETELASLKIDRCKKVCGKLGCSRSTLYLLINDGLFPAPIKIHGDRASGWLDYEPGAIISARIADKSNTEIRDLVNSLLEKRAKLIKSVSASFLGVA